MDASAVPSIEKGGAKYYDFDGNEQDVFKTLSLNGINYIRVRVWNDPFDSDGNGYGGGNSDINNALAIGKRATKYGMKLLVDFHYSDFWADPMKQTAPKAWKDYTQTQKKDALYKYTFDSLTLLKNNGVDVGMVQVGNETNNFKMAGETVPANTIALMAEGSKAVREVYPQALVAVHFTNPEKGRHPNNAKTLYDNGLDYDVFGTSYYPYWHGTLDNLKSTLSYVASHYNKKVMVMETSYANTTVDTDLTGNTSPSGSDVTPYDISVAGQTQHVKNVIDTMKDTTNGLGVCYWEGTWITAKAGGTWNEYQRLWGANGSGWANHYAKEYDADVKQYLIDGSGNPKHEGSKVDNEAFFDKNGKPYESLKVFNHEETPVDPDPGEETEYLDEYIVKGGFEDASESIYEAWKMEFITEGIEGIGTFWPKTDAKTEGSYGLNLWNEDPVHFRMYQEIKDIPAGKFKLSFDLMGECATYAAKLFVSVNGTDIATKAASLTGWNNWSSVEQAFELEEKTTIKVGLDMDFQAAGGWCWMDKVSLVHVNN